MDRGIGTAGRGAEALASRVAWWPGNANEMGIPKYSEGAEMLWPAKPTRGGFGQQGIFYITLLFS